MALKDLLKIDFQSAGKSNGKTAKTDAEVVAEVYALTAAAGHHFGTAAIQAALYQDDDAHETCSLTACLNPLHPGPCKGWKGTLHEVSPGAWHALEAARVEKANHRRIQKIEALKQAGKPIPHKLLTPIVAKTHPNAGKTANAATGEAHAAGKAVSDAAGVHVNEPGKVTLGQAIKPVPQNTGEKGPKGKKPTVASKGIAHVIGQEKVTPQYKLDKAASITPEQWAGLSAEDKASIRDELAKIKKDGFGPQQKKADELLAKLPGKPKAVDNFPAAPKSYGDGYSNAANWSMYYATYQNVSINDKIKAWSALTLNDWNGFSAADHKQVADDLLSAYKSNPLERHKIASALAHAAEPGTPAHEEWTKKAAVKYTPTMALAANLHAFGSTKTQSAKENVTAQIAPAITKEEFDKLTLGEQATLTKHLTAQAAGKYGNTPTKKAEATGALARISGESTNNPYKVTLKPKLKPGTPGTITTPSGKVYQKVELKPKPLPAHVNHAIDMANGHAPGATWSKNHLAAYQPLTAEEFHALPKDTQGKIVTELTKGQSKFLDPKKIQASKDLLAKFGKGPATPSTPKAEVPKAAEKTVGFSTHLHDHSVTQAQAKEAVGKTHISGHFLAAKHAAGLTSADNPDSSHHSTDALHKADEFVDSQTQQYDAKILHQSEVHAAVEHTGKALHDLKYAQSVHEAKTHAYNKISTTLANDNGKLSPIEKASLQHYQNHLLNHPVKTDTASMDKLQKDAAASIDDLHVKLQAAQKQANAPKPEDMSPAQIGDRAKALLGEEAVDPKIYLSLSELKEAGSTGQHHADLVAAKYPPGVVTNPAVAAKHDALEKANTQLIATTAMKQKLADHLNAHYGAGEGGVGLDVHGHPLTADDKKVIALYAAQLKAAYSHLDVSQAAQTKKLAEAQDAFHAAAAKAQGQASPAGLHKLSDYDKSAIEDEYTKAWTKHASSAVLYGVKTYSQKQDMKAHPEYAPLTQDLGSLRALSGKLAVAHAQEHTAQLNVPTNPETGDLEHGPEWDAWKNAASARKGLESQFEVLHKGAQAKLDKIRADVGLKKRALPKVDSAAVKTAAAEGGYYTSASYGGPNHGKPAAAKNYMLAKVGPKLAVAHKTAAEKKLDKLGYGAGPPATTSKIKNVASGPTVKLGGDSSISHIPDPLKKQITSDFKGMPSGKYMSDPAEDIFGNLVTLAAAHGKTVPDGLSVDQVLKAIDETHSKNMGFENKGMLHKKITDWLGTAAGKQYAESHSTADAKAVKQLTGEVDLPKGVTLAAGEKVQKLAGPGAHDTSLSAKDFHPHTSAEAQVEQDAYKKAQGIVWTGAQKKAMTAYTSNGLDAYTGINNYLRGDGPFSQVVKQYAVDIQSAMMPLREHTLLKRGTGWPPGLASFASHPEDLMGKTFEDKGFVSSSAAGSGGHFSGKPLQLVIEAPKGTAAVFVNGISHYKGSENEMLLAAGTKFKVLSVDKTSGGHTLLRVRVVGDK